LDFREKKAFLKRKNKNLATFIEKKIIFLLKGVILFILLSGVPPFFGPNDNAILEMVKQRKFSFDSNFNPQI